MPAAVFLLAAGVYLNSLPGRFVYDDHPIIAENPLVRGPISPARILASSYWERGESASSARHGGLYRPFTVLTFAWNWHLGGRAPSFHAVNVALHGLAAVLLYFLILRLGLSGGAAGFGALAFAALPIHVEAVSWAVGRAELLGAVFFFAAWLLLHLRESRGMILAGLACYMAALLSKESSASLPAVLVLGEAFRRREPLLELARRRLLVWSAAFGVLFLYLAWRRAVLGSAFFVGTPYFKTQSGAIVALTMAKFLFRGWLGPMATGLWLTADYSRPVFPDAAFGDPWAWAALAAILASAAWALRAFFTRRTVSSFAVLAFVCLAAPMLNVLVPMEILGAERIEYLPSAAFCILAAGAWEAMGKRRALSSKRTAVAAAILAWWSCLTVARNRIWRDDAAFYRAAGSEAPVSPRILTGLGLLSDRAGRHAEAREYYKRALKGNPDQVQAIYDMGKSFLDEGDWRSAKPLFASLEARPSADTDVLCMLGIIAEREGRPGAALGYYARTLERDPTHPEARRNLGLLLYRLGKTPEAVAQLRRYLGSGPPPEDAAEIGALLSRSAGP